MNKVIVMNITYTAEKKFTQEQVQALFLSVGWVSGEYPSRLYKALKHSSTVITAWDGEQLIGLVRVLDDSEMVAYMHYVLVQPEYHGHGIAGNMIEMVKKNIRIIFISKSCQKNERMLPFMKNMVFQIMQDGVAMQMCNFLDRR